MAMTASASATIVNLYAVDVDDLLQAPPESEHGGELETSLLLFLAPQWVRAQELEDVPPDPSLVRRYSWGGRTTPPPGSRGTIGFPTRASMEKGAACYARYVDSLVEILARPEPGRFSRLDDSGSIPQRGQTSSEPDQQDPPL
jgi:creatinine amidohydrolase/Fe(II)-dependent formamide hydrolase-like protein